MISKILFLALFCAAHVQGLPASSPRENPDRVVNTWSDVGNTDTMKTNFSPNDSGNHNSDVNAGHNVVIVNSHPDVIQKEETSHATSKPLMEIDIKTNMLKGRLANSLHAKPHRVINVWNEVDITGHVKENFGPNDGGHHNSNVNGGHNIVIVESPPEVYEKIETGQVVLKDNADYIVVHHRAPTIVREKIVTARPVTEERTRTSPVEESADKFGHSFGLVVEDNIHNVGREAASVLDVGRSVGGAIGTLLDSKANLRVSAPRVNAGFFGSLG